MELVGKSPWGILDQPDGKLLFTSWFALLIPKDRLTAKPLAAGADQYAAEAAKWREIACPEGVVRLKGQAMLQSDDAFPLVKFITADDNVLAYMQQRVYDWFQTHFDEPEFWIRGVDKHIAVKESGQLVGGVAYVKLGV